MKRFSDFKIEKTALVLVDLQNDFIHPEGAYGRAGQSSQGIAALAERLAPLAELFRDNNGWIVSTHFTLVPMKDGEPFIAAHLRELRPFLKKGDFVPGGWGQDLFDRLKPADITIEKVAYSAFYMSRLEFALNKAGIEHLLFAGIVTNGGVASTLRDAHVRGFDCALLDDGCGAFSQARHDAALADMGSIADRLTVAQAIEVLERSNAGRSR